MALKHKIVIRNMFTKMLGSQKKSKFQVRFSEEERHTEAILMLKKYPDRVPIIIQTGDELPILDKSKYLVPRSLSIGEFLYVLRKRMKLDAQLGVYMFFNSNLLPTSALIGDIYLANRDTDLFLYGFLYGENTFG